jgi:hypothetical protein
MYPTCYLKVEINEDKIIAMICIKIIEKLYSLTNRRDMLLKKAFPRMEKKQPRLLRLNLVHLADNVPIQPKSI